MHAKPLILTERQARRLLQLDDAAVDRARVTPQLLPTRFADTRYATYLIQPAALSR